MTKDDFKECGLKIGPATLLTKEVQTFKEKPKRVFSSYKSLKEVLMKYGIDSNGTDIIPLFSLQTHEIQETDKHFEHCMAEILVRLKNYRTLVVDSLEAMRNEYAVAILHSAINITRDATGKELSMRPEYEVIGEESSGRVDYAIKSGCREPYLHYGGQTTAECNRRLRSEYQTAREFIRNEQEKAKVG
ncbi:hypothetical protein GLOIN_2v1587390 [Rhizophagus clarus]|uniref:Uncharacterized protein n=1 Tax=Rhizophagus clarus TaxID=94130 RepID=A0A8H3LJI8_9GLOM|nr:hypothetical protein GLOIN_2v1587390 [Rhizophagus clarus]